MVYSVKFEHLGLNGWRKEEEEEEIAFPELLSSKAGCN